jgi:hypothetical protein
VEKIRTEMVNISLQEELINRVIAVCAEQEITIQEFVIDAIIEKLELVHAERQNKPRL